MRKHNSFLCHSFHEIIHRRKRIGIVSHHALPYPPSGVGTQSEFRWTYFWRFLCGRSCSPLHPFIFLVSLVFLLVKAMYIRQLFPNGRGMENLKYFRSKMIGWTWKNHIIIFIYLLEAFCRLSQGPKNWTCFREYLRGLFSIDDHQIGDSCSDLDGTRSFAHQGPCFVVFGQVNKYIQGCRDDDHMRHGSVTTLDEVQ